VKGSWRPRQGDHDGQKEGAVTTDSSAAVGDLEAIRSAVAAKLGGGAVPFGDDDDLFGQGIDSIRLMQLAAGWRRAGIKVTFAELAERPTVAAWARLIAGRAQAQPGRVGTSPANRTAPPGVTAPASRDDAAAGPFGLAPMQQAYWIGRDDGQLEAAVRGLLAGHEMLRARFGSDGRQEILPESPWPGLAVHDLRQAPDAAARLAGLRTRLAGYRLAVDRGEVFDVQLSLLPAGRTRVHLNVDMLVCDAHSFRLLLEELARRYAGQDQAPVGYSFRGYLAELAACRSEAHERGRQYWRSRLPELPGPPQLPLATEPGRITSRRPGRRCRWLDPATRAALAGACAQRQLTLPVAVGTCFAEVLAAWSAEPRFLLNLPLFDREQLHPDVDRVVGDFTNLIVLAVDLSARGSFTEHAGRLQARLRQDIGHSEYFGLEVLRDIARDRPGRVHQRDRHGRPVRRAGAADPGRAGLDQLADPAGLAGSSGHRGRGRAAAELGCGRGAVPGRPGGPDVRGVRRPARAAGRRPRSLGRAGAGPGT
jgi:aryl carrier-like protein